MSLEPCGSCGEPLWPALTLCPACGTRRATADAGQAVYAGDARTRGRTVRTLLERVQTQMEQLLAQDVAAQVAELDRERARSPDERPTISIDMEARRAELMATIREELEKDVEAERQRLFKEAEAAATAEADAALDKERTELELKLRKELLTDVSLSVEQERRIEQDSTARLEKRREEMAVAIREQMSQERREIAESKLTARREQVVADEEAALEEIEADLRVRISEELDHIEQDLMERYTLELVEARQHQTGAELRAMRARLASMLADDMTHRWSEPRIADELERQANALEALFRAEPNQRHLLMERLAGDVASGRRPRPRRDEEPAAPPLAAVPARREAAPAPPPVASVAPPPSPSAEEEAEEPEPEPEIPLDPNLVASLVGKSVGAASDARAKHSIDTAQSKATQPPTPAVLMGDEDSPAPLPSGGRARSEAFVANPRPDIRASDEPAAAFDTRALPPLPDVDRMAAAAFAVDAAAAAPATTEAEAAVTAPATPAPAAAPAPDTTADAPSRTSGIRPGPQMEAVDLPEPRAVTVPTAGDADSRSRLPPQLPTMVSGGQHASGAAPVQPGLPVIELENAPDVRPPTSPVAPQQGTGQPRMVEPSAPLPSTQQRLAARRRAREKKQGGASILSDKW